MKRFYQLLNAVLCASAIALTAVSCEENMNESYLGAITVTLEAPETYPDMPLSGLQVTILNTTDGVRDTVISDNDGKALFEELTAGSYNISVNGTYDNATINGVSNGVLVVSQETTEVTVALTAVFQDPMGPYSGLVIKEIFYSGHSMNYDPMGAAMLKDQFIELYNNSERTIYLDGLHIADAWTPATADFENAPLVSILEDPTLDHSFLYANIVIKVPGNGEDYPLEPGESFLIATNAINFKSEVQAAADEYGMGDLVVLDHIIDLSTADMETYAVQWLQSQGREGNEYFDFDNPDVPNMENVYLSEINDYFLWEMSGSAPFIFMPEKELGTEDIIIYTYQPQNSTTDKEMALMRIPVECVIDGADFVNDMESAKWKRLPDSIDIGFGYIPNDNGSMTNFSQRRKVDSEASAKAGRTILQDTNNTTNDFEPVDPPTPKGGYAE